MAFRGLYFSPKSDVAASFRPTVAAVANWSPDAAASQEPAVSAAKTLIRQYSGKQIAHVPVVVQSQVPVIRKMQKTVEVLKCILLTRLSRSQCRDRHSPSTKLSMCQRCSKRQSLWSSTSRSSMPSCEATPVTSRASEEVHFVDLEGSARRIWFHVLDQSSFQSPAVQFNT